MAFIVLLGFGLAGGALLMAFGPGTVQQPPPQPPHVADTDLEELLANFSAMLAEDPENQQTLGIVAGLNWELAGQQENPEMRQQLRNTALDYYVRMINLSPDNVELMTYVAALANEAGNDGLVQEIFEKALQSQERNPEDVDLTVGVAVLAYSRAGNDAKAQELFHRALQLDGNNINALTHYGFYLMNHKDDFAGAVAHFERALEQEMSEHHRYVLETILIHANSLI